MAKKDVLVDQELPPLEDMSGAPVNEVPEVEEKETPAPKTAKADKVEAEPAGEPEAPAAVVEAINAPNTWGGEAKTHWDKLPRSVQEVVAKREKEIHAGIEQYRGKAELGSAFEQMVTPYVPILRASGQEPMVAVQNILQTAYQMRVDPYRTTLSLIQQYGVDMNQLLAMAGYQGAQQGQPAAVDPTVRQLMVQQQQLQAYLQQQQLTQQQRDDMEADQQIAQFQSDPSKEFFADPEVRATMGRLMQAGLARDLNGAYEQACGIVGHVKAQITARQTAEIGAGQAQKQRQKAADAKRAAVDVVEDTGNPFPQDDRGDDLRVSLRKNFRRLSATG